MYKCMCKSFCMVCLVLKMSKHNFERVLILVLASVSLVNTFTVFVPNNKRLIYKYQAYISTGTDIPVPYISELKLHGDLEVTQDEANCVVVKLTNLKCRVYNGRIKSGIAESDNDADSPLPEEVKDLQNAFKIKYNENGTVSEIVTNIREYDYIRNIRKSIASILQINHQTLAKHSQSFVHEEPSIYGPQIAYYTVKSKSHDILEVQKVFELSSTNRWYGRHFTNSPPHRCDSDVENPISQTSQRRYIIRKSKEPVVEILTGSGEIFYTPYKGKSESFYVVANQTMILVKIDSVKESRNFENDHYKKDTLTYKFFNDDMEESDIIPDITHSRKNVDANKLMPDVLQKLKDINSYFDEDHLTPTSPSFSKGQLIEACRRNLVQFSLENLKKIYKELKDDDIKKTFRQMLPLLGTKASFLYIKNLITENNNDLTDDEAQNMLKEMPLNVMVPTKQLLDHMLELLKLKLTWSVKKAVIFSFGTLIQQTYKYEDQSMKLNKLSCHETNNINNDCFNSEKTYEQKLSGYQKYIDMFLEQIKHAKTSEERLSWLAGLTNSKLANIVEPLLMLLTESWCDHSHKVSILWSISKIVEEDSNMVFKIYWPLLIDRSQHPEIRMISYLTIMESRPSLSQFSNIFWFMQSELNDEMYNLHYTFVSEMSDSKNPCYSKIKSLCGKLQPYMRKPKSGISSFHLKEYVDPTYNYGMSYMGVILFTNSSVTLVKSSTSQICNLASESDFIYLRMDGLYSKFKPLEMEIIAKTNCSITVSRKHNTVYFEQMTGLPLCQFFSKVYNTEVKQNSLSISYEMYSKLFLPTDLGLLAFWSYIVPVASKTSLDYKINVRSEAIKVHIDNKYQEWIHSKHGLQFYNPIHDIYQRVIKFHSHDTSLPILMDIELHNLNKNVKISWKRHKDNKKIISGVKTHVTTVVYAMNSLNRGVEKNVLGDYVTMVSAGSKYRHNYTFFDEDFLLTGTHWKHMAFDMEKYMAKGSYKTIMFSMAQPRTKNFNNFFEYLFLTLLNIYHYNILQPETGTHGILFRLEPLQNYEATSIDLNFKYDVTFSSSGKPFHINMKLYNKISYSLKANHDDIKTWDLLVVWNRNHLGSDLKLNFTISSPGVSDYKMCLNASKVFSRDRITGKVKIFSGYTQSQDICPQDDTFDITMTAEESIEQKSKHVYGSCKNPVPHFMKPFKTYQCIADHFTLRKNSYTVKTSDKPSNYMQRYLSYFWNIIRGYNFNHYNFIDEHDVHVEKNSVNIEVLYPMDSDQVDLKVYTPQHLYSLTGVPTKMYKWLGLEPDNTEFTNAADLVYTSDVLNYCHVRQDFRHILSFNDKHINHEVPNEWTLYMKVKLENADNSVYLKKVPGNLLAMKLTYKGNVTEVDPDSADYWVNYKPIMDGISNSTIFVLPHAATFIEYEKDNVKIGWPRFTFERQGKCLEQME